MSRNQVYASRIRQCIATKSVSSGRLVHLEIVQSGYGGTCFLGNLLVQLYGVCGRLDEAEAAFREIRRPSLYSTTVLLGAHVQNGDLRGAKALFDCMAERDDVAWRALLTGYAQRGHVAEACRVFERMPVWSCIAWNCMIAVHGRNRDVEQARYCFERMAGGDGSSWYALLVAYAENGHREDARQVLERMPQWSVSTCDVVLAASAQAGDTENGEKLFSRMPDRSLVSWNSLLLANAKRGDLHQSKRIFDAMQRRNIVSWNLLIASHSRKAEATDARECFERMPVRNEISWTQVVAAHGLRGDIKEARALFDEAPERTFNLWGATIAAHAQNDDRKTAFQLLKLMDLEGLRPAQSTLAVVLSVLARAGELLTGKLIHRCFEMTGEELSTIMANALVNLYAKCGCLDEAKAMFASAPWRNTITWSSLVAAYARSGLERQAAECFWTMRVEGIDLDEIAFTNILSACSYRGASDAAWSYFISMVDDHCITPTKEHYSCIMDLIARSRGNPDNILSEYLYA